MEVILAAVARLADQLALIETSMRGEFAPAPDASTLAAEVTQLASAAPAGGAKLSVMPDRGGRSDLIAAARRAAQAASGGAASGHDACAPELAVLSPASGIGRLHPLIGATAAVLIVLGLIQILVSPADETTLMMPSHTALGPDALPALGPGLASVPAITASAADPFLSASTPEPEATGKVRLSPAATNGTAAATAASTIPVAPRLRRAAPTSILQHRVPHNKKCVRAWRVRRTSVECARLSAESRAYFAGIPPAMPSR